MSEQLSNGQDLIDDARQNGAWARSCERYPTFADWQQDSMYECARGRAEYLYGRGRDYDTAARAGWNGK